MRGVPHGRRLRGVVVTREQYERWIDFARRMGSAYPRRSKAAREKLAEYAVAFIVTHCNNGRDVERVSGWDDTKNGSGYVCDSFDTWWWDGLRFWQGAPSDYYEDGRDGEPAAFRRWVERWPDAVNCCVRAGLDVASSPSAGVVGFTVGDLKRMYPEGIPSWVSDGYQNKDGSPLDLNAEPSDAGVWL